MGLAHRDIKVENLLFDEDFKLIITDFGYSGRFTKYKYGFVQANFLGTPGYCGPVF